MCVWWRATERIFVVAPGIQLQLVGQMASPKQIRGALRSFLGTYTSRYSAFDRFWLFGFIVGRVSDLRIDLMCPLAIVNESAPLAAAREVARAKFQEQLVKNGVAASVASAWLLIEVSPTGAEVRPHWRNAQPVRFTVEASSIKGVIVSESVVIQVAPHDPRFEQQSDH